MGGARHPQNCARAPEFVFVLPHLVRDFARERDREALLGPLRLDPLVQEVRRVAESVRRPDHLAAQLREEHVHPSEGRVRRLVHKVAQERGLAHGISRYASLEALLARNATEHDCVRRDCLAASRHAPILRHERNAREPERFDHSHERARVQRMAAPRQLEALHARQ